MTASRGRHCAVGSKRGSDGGDLTLIIIALELVCGKKFTSLTHGDGGGLLQSARPFDPKSCRLLTSMVGLE